MMADHLGHHFFGTLTLFDHAFDKCCRAKR